MPALADYQPSDGSSVERHSCKFLNSTFALVLLFLINCYHLSQVKSLHLHVLILKHYYHHYRLDSHVDRKDKCSRFSSSATVEHCNQR